MKSTSVVVDRAPYRTKSSRGSVGGKGVHWRNYGMLALMHAPQLYRPTALRPPMGAPMGAKSAPRIPKPRQCGTCGEHFPSHQKWGKHYHACTREGAD